MESKRMVNENAQEFLQIVRMDSLQVKLERYEKALKNIKRNLEDVCGTVDRPRRPTIDDVFEVYLIVKETLE